MNQKVCVCGLGYVGLPLAIEFAKNNQYTIGFDVDSKKINLLKSGKDPIGEIGDTIISALVKNKVINFTQNPSDIKEADFVIMAVPTPITKNRKPDLSYVEGVAKTVGQNLKMGAIIILESTVYPGVTEDILGPILEKESGMTCGTDFKIGYSPERINPGDTEHTIDKVIKVVSGMDEDSTDKIATLYRTVAKAGVFRAKDIKTAEAAKVIENIQRDLNIALTNELSIIFDKMGIDTKSVIDAAATKWNFHRYTPGLVGGHCIPVDPYYLVHKAEELGYNPKVILAGRTINDYMPKHVAEQAIKCLNSAEKIIKGSKVLIAGLTFKENVKDTRTSPAKDIIKYLNEFEIDIYGYDPLLTDEEINSFGITSANTPFGQYDGIIIMSPHEEIKSINLKDLKNSMSENPVIIDVKGSLNFNDVKSNGFIYKKL
ncbi:MAG: nucleotide sugar dehydrogenase [DPANN group archaeon]|nr:nucleotide sugar dehydrogenase [DPANN group archaeon]